MLTPAKERAIHQMMEHFDAEIRRMADSLAALMTQSALVHRLTGPVSPDQGGPPGPPPPGPDVSRETMPYGDQPPGQDRPPFPDVTYPGSQGDPASDAAGFVSGPDR